MPNGQVDLPQGTLDLLMLKTLKAGSKRGYAIAQRIQQRSDEVLVVKEGSLYPALYRMKDQGWSWMIFAVLKRKTPVVKREFAVMILLNQHGVAIAEEAIFLADSLLIGV